MKKITSILASFLALFILPGGVDSCAGNSPSLDPSAADMSSASADSVKTDTIDYIPDEVIEEEPVLLSFSTPEEAVEYMRESPDWDRYSKGILPQMAEEELDYATRLLNNTHDGFIVVDKKRMKVIKFNRFGEPEVTYGMACAKKYGTKHKSGDSRTPEGFFSVKRIHDSTGWHYVDDNGVESTKTGEFGPRFIRLEIPGTSQIGIHGTCAPWSIGGRRSHGCIRIKNENIMELVEMVDSGMPVIITPGKRDVAVNKEEGYDIPSISTIPRNSEDRNDI